MVEHAPGAAAAVPGTVARNEQSADPSLEKPYRAESRPAGWDRGFKKFLWENGLSIVVLGLFLLTLVGQVGTGLLEYNKEQREHGQPTMGFGEYLTSGHFIEATAENW